MYLLYQRYTHNTIIIWKETKKKLVTLINKINEKI